MTGDIITIINKARKNHPALQSTWNIHFCEVSDPNLIAYIKTTDDLSSVILIVVNLDPHNKHAGYLQLPKTLLKLGASINVKLNDIMTDEYFTSTQEWNFVELNPYKLPFHLFTVAIHESNM
jgi:starch synthase (maltosyl-transferring)